MLAVMLRLCPRQMVEEVVAFALPYIVITAAWATCLNTVFNTDSLTTLVSSEVSEFGVRMNESVSVGMSE